MGELFLLLLFADTPVNRLEAVDQRLEDVIDYNVEGGDCVLGDLTEENLVIVGSVHVHWLARRGSPVEVDTLALESLLFTY